MASSTNGQAADPNTSEASGHAPLSADASKECCVKCNTTTEAPKHCNKCHSASYCSKDCQKAHYKTHKKECAALAQSYMQTHEPKLASRAPPRVADRSTGFRKWQFDT